MGQNIVVVNYTAVSSCAKYYKLAIKAIDYPTCNNKNVPKKGNKLDLFIGLVSTHCFVSVRLKFIIHNPIFRRLIILLLDLTSARPFVCPSELLN